MKYLLDTNTCIDHIRKGANSNVTARLRLVPAGSVHICSIVLAELIYGAFNAPISYQAKNLSLLADVRKLPSVPFDDRATDVCGQLRAS